MNKWLFAFLVLVALYLAGSLISLFLFRNDGVVLGDKIVVVPLDGEITVSGNQDFFQVGGVSSTELIKTIQELDEDSSVKGVIFEINSPGGGVVASQEIASAVKSMNKTKYSVIREFGASGAYWIASATDKIIVSPLSITGSIGVYGSYLEFSELFDKYGVGYQRLVSGKYKDLGVPYRNLTDEERKLFQGKLDIIHEYFIMDVAKNRHMNFDNVKDVATGEFFLGVEAKKIGLVDELGDKDTAVELMKKQLNLTDVGIVESRKKVTLLDRFFGDVAYQLGRGFGKSIVEFNTRLRINA